MRKLRPVIPASMRFYLFCYFHNLAHPEIRGSVRLLTDVVVWNETSKDVATWARQCLQCSRSKVHTLAPFQKISSLPTSRFTHVYVDLTGHLPPSNGYRFLKVAVFRFSCYFQAIPIKGITAEECASSFLSGWVSLFGSPSHVYCDCGSQFTSSTWKELISFFGAKLHHATSYHPQAQGIVERVNQILKTALKASGSPSELYWLYAISQKRHGRNFP